MSKSRDKKTKAAAAATKSISFGKTKFVIPKTSTTPAIEGALKKFFSSGGKLEKVLAEDLQAKSRTDYQVSLKILRDY